MELEKEAVETMGANEAGEAMLKNQNEAIKILLVEDDPGDIETMKRCINEDRGMRLVGITGDVRKAKRLMETHKPHAVILDLRLECGDGMEFIEWVDNGAHCFAKPYILVTTQYCNMWTVERVTRAGAGFVYDKMMEGYCPEKVVHAIRQAFRFRKPQETSMREMTPEDLLRDRVSTRLINGTITPNLLGHDYIVECLVTMWKGKKKRASLNRDIYPIVAEKFGTNLKNVEKNIRYALEKGFSDMTPEEIGDFYKPVVSSRNSGVPSNKQFLYYMAQLLGF